MTAGNIAMSVGESVIPTLVAFSVTCSYYFQRVNQPLGFRYTLPGFFISVFLTSLVPIIDGNNPFNLDTVSGTILFIACPLISSWTTVKALFYCKNTLNI